MRIIKARVEWGEAPAPGKHFGVRPCLHILVDALHAGEWRYTYHGPAGQRVYFAAFEGEARFIGSSPRCLTRSSYSLTCADDGAVIEFPARGVDEATVNYLAFAGAKGFEHVVRAVLYTPMEGAPVCQGVHFVTLEFAQEAAEKCAPPVFLAQERFGWDGSSWYWVPSVKPDTPALPNEEEE